MLRSQFRLLLCLAALTGACFNPKINEGVTCGEGDSCPTGMQCDPADNKCRVTPIGGAMDAGECTENVDCDDGIFCNGEETCSAGQCVQAAAGPDCRDQVDCTEDACSASSDSCTHTPIHTLCVDEGSPTCSVTLGCILQECANNLACDDGVFCNGAEVCDLGTTPGICRAGTNPICPDDGVACTVETCDAGMDGCSSDPSDAVCDDGLFCNGAETCDAASGCQTAVSDCVSDACFQRNCDEANDQCITSAKTYQVRWETIPNGAASPDDSGTISLTCNQSVTVGSSPNYCKAGTAMSYRCQIGSTGVLNSGQSPTPFDISCLGFAGDPSIDLATNTGCSKADALPPRNGVQAKSIECCFP